MSRALQLAGLVLVLFACWLGTYGKAGSPALMAAPFFLYVGGIAALTGVFWELYELALRLRCDAPED